MATADVKIPHDWNVNDSEAVISNDPQKIYKEYDYMRQNCPVVHCDRHNGSWMLTKYEDVKNVCSDGQTFVSSVCAIIPGDPRGIRRPPLKFDGKEHTPYRTALDRTLRPAWLKCLEPLLEAHAERELGLLLKRGHGNTCSEFGAKFPALVEKEWLNLDDRDSKLLAESVNPFVQSWRTGDWGAVKRASDSFYKIARRVVAAREVTPMKPEEDLASSLLLECDHDGQPLDNSPLEEFVRLYTPYKGFARTAVCPVTLSGTVVPEKEPTTFDAPNQFNMDRENINTQLGFGRGRHRCAGMALARMMLKVVLQVFLKNRIDFEIDGEPEFARVPEICMIGCPMKFRVREEP
ncbi:cytochrome P450 [Lophiotrema nucula]|uniref:Cytochrome P450 n=1 Tax=Lophiotrema nucula TaxID=690887 RepID=A0A6A5YEB5_9PLEO|nr:cytochrome P450 [Lophiotrema nucula]